MWQRFTAQTRNVILLAQAEAYKMNAYYVGTEHLLLGLLRENESVAAQILQKTGISLGEIRQEIEDKTERSDASPPSELKLTPKAKRF